MRFVISIVLLCLASLPARACPSCRPQVEAGIYEASWGANLTQILLPLGIIGLIAAAVHHAEPIAARLRRGNHR